MPYQYGRTSLLPLAQDPTNVEHVQGNVDRPF